MAFMFETPPAHPSHRGRARSRPSCQAEYFATAGRGCAQAFRSRERGRLSDPARLERDPRSRAAQLGRVGQRARLPISRCRTCRSAMFRRRGRTEQFRGGVAIGDQILDLGALCRRDLLSGDAREAAESCRGPTLNAFMALGPDAWSALRLALSRAAARRRAQGGGNALARSCRCSRREHALPARIGDYTDFYASIQHATNVGRMFRPDNPLLPNYKWVPIGYHGRELVDRASRDSPSTAPWARRMPHRTPMRRCWARRSGSTTSSRSASSSGPATRSANRSPSRTPQRHVFGLCLLNDWSARDIQAWEYQPLGPFLSKNFATTISPWVVTLRGAGAVPRGRGAVHRTTRSRCPISMRPRSGGRGDSTSSSRSCSQTAQHARTRAVRPCASRATNLRDMYWTVDAAGGAPHGERLQPAAGRSPRHRHPVGARRGRGRIAARAHARRQADRSRCPTARPAAFSRTATASSCAATPKRPARRGWDSARRSARCSPRCRRSGIEGAPPPRSEGPTALRSFAIQRPHMRSGPA